jgi:endo-1,4-beta-mannosidase
MWSQWNPTTINADFARLSSLHVTAVRIFLQPSEFGYPNPSAGMMNELSQVVHMAAQNGMKTYFNLFDGFKNFGDVSSSMTWAKAVVSPYAGTSDTAAFEVFNEINPSYLGQVTWARQMIPYVQSLARGTPVGISVNAGWKLKNLKGSLQSKQPDFYSFHYYTSLANAQAHAATDIAGDAANAAPMPLIVGETGFPTWNGVIGSGSGSGSQQESDQRSYLSAVQQASIKVGVGTAGIYTQHDFTSLTIPEPERYFGLYRSDGTPKPAVQILSTYF